METKIYYRVQNGGDGSASVFFYDSKELAEMIDDHENEYGEGFAESTVSYITVNHDSPITFDAESVCSVMEELEKWEDVLEPENDHNRNAKKLYEELKTLV